MLRSQRIAQRPDPLPVVIGRRDLDAVADGGTDQVPGCIVGGAGSRQIVGIGGSTEADTGYGRQLSGAIIGLRDDPAVGIGELREIARSIVDCQGRNVILAVLGNAIGALEHPAHGIVEVALRRIHIVGSEGQATDRVCFLVPVISIIIVTVVDCSVG